MKRHQPTLNDQTIYFSQPLDERTEEAPEQLKIWLVQVEPCSNYSNQTKNYMSASEPAMAQPPYSGVDPKRHKATMTKSESLLYS